MKKIGRLAIFPTIPEPFISIRIVSKLPLNCLLKKFSRQASFTPLFCMTSTDKGEMSMAFTVFPISCNASEWQPLPAPTFWLNPEVKDFYDFTPDDVRLDNYETHPQIKNIPIAV